MEQGRLRLGPGGGPGVSSRFEECAFANYTGRELDEATKQNRGCTRMAFFYENIAVTKAVKGGFVFLVSTPEAVAAATTTRPPGCRDSYNGFTPSWEAGSQLG